MNGLVYLDASALIKLVFDEPETDAMFDFLRAHNDRTSSVVARVEVMRAARRAGSAATQARGEQVLRHLDLVHLNDGIIARAVAVQPATVRSLDAIHLATAMWLAADLSGMIVYDRRLAAAARAAGLTVWAPA